MRKILAAAIAVAAVVVAVSPAAASPGHELTTTVRCTGGTLYVVDGNAYDGQVIAQTTWNTVNKFRSICYVDPQSEARSGEASLDRVPFPSDNRSLDRPR
jgi:hypothetical protein